MLELEWGLCTPTLLYQNCFPGSTNICSDQSVPLTLAVGWGSSFQTGIPVLRSALHACTAYNYSWCMAGYMHIYTYWYNFTRNLSRARARMCVSVLVCVCVCVWYVRSSFLHYFCLDIIYLQAIRLLFQIDTINGEMQSHLTDGIFYTRDS